jgi:predicted transcriptional regulator of viral defense system
MKYQEFRKLINRPFFRKSDVDFSNSGVSSVQLSRWANVGYIEQLKRGIYVFDDSVKVIDSSQVSFLLYEPSYISLESALRHYDLIPEMITSTTAVTTRTNREFSNRYGIFSYRHIRPELFFGYNAIETPSGKYLMAEPEKAILDYVYLNQRRLSTMDEIEGLRLNTHEFLSVIDTKRLKEYLAWYDSRNMDRIISLILEHVNL